MATREQVHKLVDELPETDLDPVAEILILRRENGTLDDAARPGDTADEWGSISEMTDAAAAQAMRDLAEEERTQFGETIAEAWQYESRG
jgi:hypothetical protein